MAKAINPKLTGLVRTPGMPRAAIELPNDAKFHPSQVGKLRKDGIAEYEWWEPELPEGEFAALIEACEAEVGGIQVELLSSPSSAARNAKRCAVGG